MPGTTCVLLSHMCYTAFLFGQWFSTHSITSPKKSNKYYEVLLLYTAVDTFFFCLTLYLTGREKSPLRRRRRGTGASAGAGSVVLLARCTAGGASSLMPSATTTLLLFRVGTEEKVGSCWIAAAGGVDGMVALGLNLGSCREVLARSGPAVMLPPLCGVRTLCLDVESKLRPQAGIHRAESPARG